MPLPCRSSCMNRGIMPYGPLEAGGRNLGLMVWRGSCFTRGRGRLAANRANRHLAQRGKLPRIGHDRQAIRDSG